MRHSPYGMVIQSTVSHDAHDVACSENVSATYGYKSVWNGTPLKFPAEDPPESEHFLVFKTILNGYQRRHFGPCQTHSVVVLRAQFQEEHGHKTDEFVSIFKTSSASCDTTWMLEELDATDQPVSTAE